MMRLQKFLAQAGVASRRKAEEMIVNGKIKVNGHVVSEMGVIINEESDRIEANDKIVKLLNNHIYIALNKPEGYISSSSSSQGKSVLKLLPKGDRVYPVGRLDKDSCGLMILTNDGDLTYELTHAKFGHSKDYLVNIDRQLIFEHKKLLEKGINIEGKQLQPVKIKIISKNLLQITLYEGINRQIRKMLGQFDYQVIKLQRIRIAKLNLNNLKEGKYIQIKKSDII